MKKATLILIAILACAAVFIVVKRHGATEAEAAGLVPANTVFFVDLPDIPRTCTRWKQTALYQLGQEPEVQAFLARPLSKVLQLAAAREKVEQINGAEPLETFLAVTSATEEIPTFLAGLKFHGKKENLDGLLGEARANAHALWPAGKADLLNYDSAQIETFTAGKLVLAIAYNKEWYFVSDDLPLLKAALDRMNAKAVSGETLANAANFKKCMDRQPGACDMLLFAQLETITDRVLSLLAAAGKELPTDQAGEIKRVQAVSFTTKLEGENIRDTAFILAPESGKKLLLDRKSLQLTSTNTLFYYAGSLPPAFSLPDAAADPTGIFRILATARDSLTRQGLGVEQFKAAFGPEFGIKLDWNPAAMEPSILASLDVLDRGKAQQFADALASNAGWARQTIEGVPYYVMNASGIPMLAPALGLNDRFLVLGPAFEEVKAGIESLKTGQPNLDKSEAYRAAAKEVSDHATAFGFLDGKGACERVYGNFRSLAILWGSFVPKVTAFVDPGKLPATETLARHLGPIVFSESAASGGTLIESTGPMTFSQLFSGLRPVEWRRLCPGCRLNFSITPRSLRPRLHPVFGKSAEPAKESTPGNAAGQILIRQPRDQRVPSQHRRVAHE